VSDFSVEWLDLREPADARARSTEITKAVAARFALRDEIRVLDLGSGSGANLRATAPLLPKQQYWNLVDRDANLLETAKIRLIAWADASEFRDGAVHLLKDGRHIRVTFAVTDLTQNTQRLFDEPWQLVTASAFFDLVSQDYVQTLAKHVTECKAAFYAALTYNGLRRWTPHRPADNQMAAAFHRHQMRNKGFGNALGPLATAHLADQFRLNGYSVLEGDSSWRLERGDRMLIEELIRSHAVAAAEIGGIDDKTIVNWINVPRTGAVIGHTDLFAAPTS
jgi:hypothetical protein